MHDRRTKIGRLEDDLETLREIVSDRVDRVAALRAQLEERDRELAAKDRELAALRARVGVRGIARSSGARVVPIRKAG